MEGNSSTHINLNEFLREKASEDILLVFTAAWLSQSSIVNVVVHKVQLALPELNVRLIDVDQNEELISRFYIDKLPSAVLIKQGLMKRKITGTFSKKDVIDAYRDES
jgi:thioredoxin-like negative regulator of GroEL